MYNLHRIMLKQVKAYVIRNRGGENRKDQPQSWSLEIRGDFTWGLIYLAYHFPGPCVCNR